MAEIDKQKLQFWKILVSCGVDMFHCITTKNNDTRRKNSYSYCCAVHLTIVVIHTHLPYSVLLFCQLTHASHSHNGKRIVAVTLLNSYYLRDNRLPIIRWHLCVCSSSSAHSLFPLFCISFLLLLFYTSWRGPPYCPISSSFFFVSLFTQSVDYCC